MRRMSDVLPGQWLVRTICSTLFPCVLAGCEPTPPEVTSDQRALHTDAQSPWTQAGNAQGFAIREVRRNRVTADVVHYSVVLRVGNSPNAELRIHRVVRERAPFVPRQTTDAVMMLHGDFSSFLTNFLPALGTPASSNTGMATYLAQHNIDVWGVDRRWNMAKAESPDLSDFADMGAAQEVDDVGVALGFAHGVRLASGAGADRLTLIGMSRGGQIAYTYASVEATRPVRHTKGLVPLDYYAEIDPADPYGRPYACEGAKLARDILASGQVDSDNFFQIAVGNAALRAPNDPSPFPFFEGLTNRLALLFSVGQTYAFFAPVPLYHLASARIEDEVATSLRESQEEVIAKWWAGATPHQPWREAADFDGILCGQAPLPFVAPLSRIEIPLFYIGAAGGIGRAGIYSTTRVRSRDVRTLIIQRLPDAQQVEDYGHNDLLYADSARELVFRPLLTWLRSH